MDFYGFYTGKIFDAYKYLGAHVEEKGVTFRTFAPSASRITLIGEFNDWQEWGMWQSTQSLEDLCSDHTADLLQKQFTRSILTKNTLAWMHAQQT